MQSIGKVRTSARIVSNVSMDSESLMVTAVRIYARSYTCASCNSCNSWGLFLRRYCQCRSRILLNEWSSSKYFVAMSYCFLVSSIMSTGGSSSRSVSLLSLVCSFKRAADAWCLPLFMLRKTAQRRARVVAVATLLVWSRYRLNWVTISWPHGRRAS